MCGGLGWQLVLQGASIVLSIGYFRFLSCLGFNLLVCLLALHFLVTPILACASFFFVGTAWLLGVIVAGLVWRSVMVC